MKKKQAPSVVIAHQLEVITSLRRLNEGLNADKKLLIEEIQICKRCNQQLLADAEAYAHNQDMYKEWQRQKAAFESERAGFRYEQRVWASKHPKPMREKREKAVRRACIPVRAALPIELL